MTVALHGNAAAATGVRCHSNNSNGLSDHVPQLELRAISSTFKPI